MGSVWAARHLQLDTLIAIKFIDAVADIGDARVRFEREARAAAQLRSPHVVQILDHGIDEEERPYIAMELLEGEDLGERLRRTPRLTLQATATIITQASKALRRAHEGGVIHRDLKPGNIFLARFDDDEVIKLLDFGVAKLRYSDDLAPGVQMTQTGVIFGSPSYMSPEQARGNRVIDHRTDLWSLAVILFRCITGSKPFEAESIGDLVIKLCIDPLPIPTKLVPSCRRRWTASSSGPLRAIRICASSPPRRWRWSSTPSPPAPPRRRRCCRRPRLRSAGCLRRLR
jgi:serine/threonine-protein kinase